MREDFAVFILTHGRADNVITLGALRRSHYTGKTYIVIDNEDEQEPLYRANFENVIVFDKKAEAEKCDSGDTSEDRRVILYARNACFEIAKQLGLKYFLELDDDYGEFEIRWAEDGKLKGRRAENIDAIFEGYIDFLESTDSLTVAMGQGGDFIGGARSRRFREGFTRKAMNTFFCRTDKPFQFVGRINEDVNTYTTLGQRGEKIFSVMRCMVTQESTQQGKGGMTDVYVDKGTYLKSFYSVMYSPSCVKIATMGDKHRRIHHFVYWDRCAPRILNARWKK